MKQSLLFYLMCTGSIVISSAADQSSFDDLANNAATRYTNPLTLQYKGQYKEAKNKLQAQMIEKYEGDMKGSLRSARGMMFLNATYFLLVMGAIVCFIFNGIVNEGVMYLQTVWSFVTMEIMNVILYFVTMSKSEITTDSPREQRWRFKLTQIFLFLLNLPPFIFTFITLIAELKEGQELNDCAVYTGSDNCESPLAIVMMVIYVLLSFMCTLKICL